MDIIKTLTGLINDVDNNDIDSLKDLYLELIHLRSELQDINYTRCCETLKDKKTLSFQDYKKLNYVHLTNVYSCKYTKQIVSYEETLEEYNKYIECF